MQIHGSDLRLKNAPTLDPRYLHVECLKHKGVLAMVTGIKIGRNGKGLPILHLEALCRYCGRYRYVQMVEGKVPGEPLPWNN